ncbi:hypothetical protein ABZY90_19730 [Streptomyces sp. NPDC006422]|uniref:hypothetical protein n=1 Tax=unclassified Streptomyces TaxID=2593676 RepID=UPI0033A3477F
MPDPRPHQLAQARQHLANRADGTTAHWDNLTPDEQQLLLEEADAWLAAATEAGILTAHDQPDYTRALDAWMTLGTTPSLQGLRTELRIEGRPVLIGRYAGVAMGRAQGKANLLSVEPRLIFEYNAAPTQPPTGCAKCKAPFDPTDTRFDGHAQERDTPYCRRCVDCCHDTEIADHRCVICT